MATKHTDERVKNILIGSKYPKVFTVRVIDSSENHEYGLPDWKSDRRPSPKAFNLSWNRSSSLTEVSWIYFTLFSHGWKDHVKRNLCVDKTVEQSKFKPEEQ